jgi:hypothetical protein
MPILNTSLKREAFLHNIARHLCGGNDRFGEVDEGAEHGKTIYFGGGYWRGLWLEGEAGVTLTNRSPRRRASSVHPTLWRVPWLRHRQFDSSSGRLLITSAV